MSDTKRAHRLMALMAAIFATVAMVWPAAAKADTVLDYDPTTTINPVADNITRLNVNKLEKGSHDGVKGAHMAIIEKETGRVVTEWVSDGTTHEVARNTDDPNRGALDIDVVYILRELEAPEGYEKAADTEFMIHSDNFNTTGEIISGPDAESDEIHGSGPEQAFVINLYDEATVNVTEEERQARRTTTESGGETQTTATQTTSGTSGSQSSSGTGASSDGEGLTKTGDDTNHAPVIACAVLGVAAMAVALVRRRRG